jgi:hypothetical protein
MKWKTTPKVKIPEALGAIGDGRVEISGNIAKIFSSSGNKFYSITFDPEKKAITSNDNSSYWVGYLGYPGIAFLLARGIVKYEPEFAEALKGVPWKDLNTKFKNDFEKTDAYVKDILEKKGVDLDDFSAEIDRIYEEIDALKLNKLGKTAKPPVGY